MKTTLYLLSVLITLTLFGCVEPEVEENCHDTDSCSDITFQDAQNYFGSFIESEDNSSISSSDHCNYYYNENVNECIIQRDSDLELNFHVSIYSFVLEDESNDIYKIGVVYHDDETDPFLEYHIVSFYRDGADNIKFSIEQSSHQYDVDDYQQLAIDYATDVMSDLSSSTICSYYMMEDQLELCTTQTQDIKDNFLSMELLELTQQTGFYTATYQFNNGDYNENIGYHFVFVVTDDDQLKMEIYE